jgi:lipopolysaccharide export system protein LptA
VFLQGDNPSEYLVDGKVERIIFVGQVVITLNTLKLTTEKAIYLADKNVLYGREKVVIREADSVIRGNQGFHLDLNQERYQIFGSVNGELRQ